MAFRTGSTSSRTRRWALVLLVLAAIPDVLPLPGVKALVSERYGLDDIGAQLFTIAALIGALAAVPFMRRLGGWSPRRIFGSAALVQALVIAAMMAPIGWPVLFLLRAGQGFVDLLLLVTLTTLVAANTPGTGRGFGLSGSAVMFGLALGLIIGGVVASFSLAAVFPVGAATSLLLALLAVVLPGESVPAFADQPVDPEQERRVITAGALMASDRMIPAMMTLSLPLLLVASFGAGEMAISLVLAMPLLACAVGGYLSGLIVDRFGALLVRTVGVPLQALGLAMIVLAGGTSGLLVLGTAALSIGSALVMPTSLVIGTGRSAHEVSARAIGGIQALGQVGYLFGALSILILTVYMGSVTAGIVLAMLGLYLVWNLLWLGRLRRLAHARRTPRFARGERRPRLPHATPRLRRSVPSTEVERSARVLRDRN